MSKIIVVGDGVIARSLIFFLAKYAPQNSYIQVSANDFYPSCSDYSTATVALRNTQRGLSPLGDLIVEGFKAFNEFILNNNPLGVEPVPHFHRTLTHSEKFLKRFGSEFYEEKSYLIYWNEYKNWLLKNVQITHINDVAINTKANKLNLKSGVSLDYDKLIWCTGIQKDKKIKVRPGSYLYKEMNITQSRIYEIDGINIILRALDKKLLIGSTTIRDNHYIAPINRLRDLHQKAKLFMKNELSLNIADFDTFNIQTGLRSLGSRMPFFGRLSDNQWGMFDFHKNGYLMSISAASYVAKDVLK